MHERQPHRRRVPHGKRRARAAGMNSNAVSPAPPCFCAKRNSGTSASSDRHRDERGRYSRGAATKRSVAAVMMPSVPSDADQQIAQVIAGVVLLQRLEPVPDAPVRQHGLDAEHLRARRPIRQHAMPPAFVARLPPMQALPSDAMQSGNIAPRPRRLLHGSQRNARLDRQRSCPPHPRRGCGHPVEREHDLGPALDRNLSADEPCVAGLRHDADPGLVGQREDARDLLRRAGPQDQRRAPDEKVAPLLEIRRLCLRAREGRAPAPRSRRSDRGDPASVLSAYWGRAGSWSRHCPMGLGLIG